MSNFWDEWESKKQRKAPAGVHIATLKDVSVSYDANGRAKTVCYLTVCEGQEYAGSSVYIDWPHIPASFGWLARKVYEAFGNEARPPGDTPEAAMLSICKILGDSIGRNVRVTLAPRPWTGDDGVERAGTKMVQVEPVGHTAPQAQQPAPQVQGYGGQGYGGNNAPGGQGGPSW